ncbi:ankyrin repeat domain-containing protein [Streptomyces boninensis]|uniref:ankyrin repeat domain-containing protein n=1 Tax=Streptomyces boninensis TaxID=2039455 RepID=UPI003B2253FD
MEDRSARLMEAVYDGDAQALERLLAEGPDAVAILRGPLYEASVEGRADLVRLLLDAGAFPDAPGANPDDGLPLCAAAAWGYTDVAAVLLDGGADADLVEWDGHTALLWAAGNGHTATALLLLDHGARTDVTDSTGRTPLHRAAERGSLRIVEALLAAGAERDARDDEGLTARELALPLVGADLEGQLRHQVRFGHEPQPGDRVVVREETADDDSRVLVAELILGGEDQPRAWSDIQTGHAAVVDLLSGVRSQ